MAKNVVFLVHGVGRHSENWAYTEDGPIPALETAARNYSYFREKKLSDLVEFVPIHIDDIFDRILKQWNDLSVGLTGAGGAPDALKAVLSLCSKGTNTSSDLIALGADVPLYRGFPLFAKRIQLAINLRIARVIVEKSKTGDGELPHYVVIAHSLGTAMAHDALHLLGTENWLDQTYSSGPAEADKDAVAFNSAHKKLSERFGTANPFAPGFVNFRSVYMISNTSRLLQTICAPDKSLVCPLSQGAAGSYCQSFINIDHKLDPVSKIMPFRVPTAWQASGGMQLEVDHFYNTNIHAFSHYLLHPDVHRNILMDLVDGFEPTNEENEKANIFPQYGGTLAAVIDAKRAAFRARIQDIVTTATSGTIAELERWLAVYRALNEIAQREI